MGGCRLKGKTEWRKEGRKHCNISFSFFLSEKKNFEVKREGKGEGGEAGGRQGSFQRAEGQEEENVIWK